MSTEIEELTRRLREFVAARDWQRFHTPKNLAMALAGEAGELLAELQWLTPEESANVMTDPEAAARVRGEVADVTVYLVRLADALGISPGTVKTHLHHLCEKTGCANRVELFGRLLQPTA